MTATLAPDRRRVARAEVESPRADRFTALVGAALLVGLVLRVAIALTDDAPTTDETAYLRSGISLIEGHGFARDGHPELHFPPFVPFLMGLASRVFSDPHTGVVVLTCLASTALIVPLALLGRRVAGPAGGIATAWVAALAPGLSTTVVNRGAGSEAEYVLLVVSAVWFVISASDRDGGARLLRVIASGLLVGLAYLTRPEGLFFAAPLGVAVCLIAVRGVPRGRRARSAVPLIAAFAAPVIVGIVPYAMYLHDNTGSWELSAKTQDASIEAWEGVARGDRQARDRVLYALDDSGLHFSATRTPLTELARDDPAGYVGIVGTNVGALVTTVFKPVESQVLSWLLLPLPLWLLVGYGVWRHRRSRTVALMVVIAALPVATALAFFVQVRYLIAAVAFAAVLLGVGIAALPGRWRGAAAAGAVVLLALSSAQAFYSTGAGWGHPPDLSDQRAAGEWIADHTRPGDRVMTRSMVIEYYAERPTMPIPYASLDQILAYARHYGARYLVVDRYTVARLRPQLEPLRKYEQYLGLRLVHKVEVEGHTTRVFALDPTPASSAAIGGSLGFVGDGLS